MPDSRATADLAVSQLTEVLRILRHYEHGQMVDADEVLAAFTARRAASRPAVGEERLDVERLTAAVFEAIYQSRATHPDDARNDAEAIATHYAALAAADKPEPEPDVLREALAATEAFPEDAPDIGAGGQMYAAGWAERGQAIRAALAAKIADRYKADTKGE